MTGGLTKRHSNDNMLPERRRLMLVRLTLIASLAVPALALGTNALAAQANRTASACGGPCMKVRAVRVATPPTIDGAIDEAMWEQIEPISDFRQREPVDGGEPSERTEVRIAYDDDNLYFGLKLFDSEPDKIIATILEREGKVPFDDRVAIGLDTFNDDRNGYMFGMNVFGTQERRTIHRRRDQPRRGLEVGGRLPQ